jgi:hypothetical protein
MRKMEYLPAWLAAAGGPLARQKNPPHVICDGMTEGNEQQANQNYPPPKWT